MARRSGGVNLGSVRGKKCSITIVTLNLESKIDENGQVGHLEVTVDVRGVCGRLRKTAE